MRSLFWILKRWTYELLSVTSIWNAEGMGTLQWIVQCYEIKDQIYLPLSLCAWAHPRDLYVGKQKITIQSSDGRHSSETPLPVMFSNVNVAKRSWNYINNQGIPGERERWKTRQLKNGKKNQAVAEKPHLLSWWRAGCDWCRKQHPRFIVWNSL